MKKLTEFLPFCFDGVENGDDDDGESNCVSGAANETIS